MELETIKLLDDCLTLLEELQRLTKEETDSIRTCIGGQPLTAYLENTEKAALTARKLKQSILLLQAELIARMQ